MQLSETVKLYLNSKQKTIVLNTMEEYIRTVNVLTALAVSGVSQNQDYKSFYRAIDNILNKEKGILERE